MTGVKLVSKPAPPPMHETPSAVPQITIMKKKDRTYEQREEEYAKARARIFGAENSNPKPEATVYLFSIFLPRSSNCLVIR